MPPKQHYVPQFYLKRFASQEQLFVFDKHARRPFKSNVSNVATERGFYDLQDTLPKVEPRVVDKALTELEGAFALELEAIVNEADTRGQLDSTHKRELSPLIAIQVLRTREFREAVTQFYEATSKRLLEEGARLYSRMKGLPETSLEVRFDEETAPMVHARFLLDSPGVHQLAQVLAHHAWVLGHNCSPQPFYSSDNPVARCPHIIDAFNSYAGLGSAGMEIAFPLDSTHLLILFDRTHFGFAASLDCRTVQLVAENVTFYNALQVESSYRQVYCQSDSFDLVRTICAKCPELCDPNRDRYEIG